MSGDRVERPSHTHLVTQLHALPLFASLDEETVAELADNARWQTYAAGETLFWEGDAAAGLYFLHAGWLKVVKSATSGREQVVKFLGPGETFNEIGAFANQPNPATAVALESVGVWLIRRQILLRLLQERPSFAQHLVAALARRVTHLVNLVAEISLHSVTTRLARFLLDDSSDGVLHRPHWYTQAELAARLGTVPDVIQRALRSLESDGLIEVERHLIRIRDRDGLQQKATE